MSDGADRPSAERLSALPADAWAEVLRAARSALADLPDDPDEPRRARLRATPTGRLAGGKGRDRLLALLAEDGELWDAVAQALPSETLAALAAEPVAGAAAVRGEDQAHEELRRRAQRDRQRLRVAREERDAALRRADGAERRAERLEHELAGARDRVAELEATLQAVRAELEAQAQERDRAVARERRRQQSERAELAEELRGLRRRDQQHRDAARTRAATPAPTQRPMPEQAPPGPTRLRPGRPSQLPEGAVRGTREAVELLLHRGRRVVVDGYNVTRQHRGELGLEQQRRWLVGALGNLAARRGIVPLVLFDGESAGGHRGGGGARQVQVRFTAAGITADDEIVLEVESTDEPITVVTDDRELIERVRASGVDVIATHELLWLL